MLQTNRFTVFLFAIFINAPVAVANDVSSSQQSVEQIIHVPAFELPLSSYLGDKSRKALRWYDGRANVLGEKLAEVGPPLTKANIAELPALRLHLAQVFYQSDIYRRLIERYPVTVTGETLGGVYCEIFTPVQGVPASNRERVLINLHGGGFIYGSRTNSHLESAPIAAVGKIKIVSVDYRMAPQYRFPAATEDVVAVYRELLKSYKPENIGIYGSSAGGHLATEALAQFQQEGLPRPAAVGMLAGGAFYSRQTDGGIIGQALLNMTLPGLEQGYFKGLAATDPRAFPGNAPRVLAKFPPSLLISSTRDFVLSSVVHTHTQLVKANVEAELYVWEGLNHVFYWNPELPESRQVHDVVVKFFSKYLGIVK